MNNIRTRTVIYCCVVCPVAWLVRSMWSSCMLWFSVLQRICWATERMQEIRPGLHSLWSKHSKRTSSRHTPLAMGNTNNIISCVPLTLGWEMMLQLQWMDFKLRMKARVVRKRWWNSSFCERQMVQPRTYCHQGQCLGPKCSIFPFVRVFTHSCSAVCWLNPLPAIDWNFRLFSCFLWYNVVSAE